MTHRSISRKQMIEMDKTSVSIKGVLDDTRTKLSILEEGKYYTIFVYVITFVNIMLILYRN